jgi:kinesin family protein 22
MADVLSPVSKKRTGRAYVALARAHSEKCVRSVCVLNDGADDEFRGDLQVALDLYRKAESYVPDNVKLKERWILFIIHVFLCNISLRSKR